VEGERIWGEQVDIMEAKGKVNNVLKWGRGEKSGWGCHPRLGDGLG